MFDGVLTLLLTKNTLSAWTDPNKPYALLAAGYPGAPLLGYLNGRAERIDSILQKALAAATIAVEPVDAKKCFRVTALVGRDTYRVWFAPFYGCQILKAEVQSGDRILYSLDKVEFREIQNLWVPVVCRVRQADGTTYTYRRSRVELKPDFQALKAFDLSIPEGMSVQVEGKSGTFLWKNGKITNQEGCYVF